MSATLIAVLAVERARWIAMVLPGTKTLFVKRVVMTYRPVPVTATRGYLQLLYSPLADRLRHYGALPPTRKNTAAERPSSMRHEFIPALRRCMGHGIVPASGCPF